MRGLMRTAAALMVVIAAGLCTASDEETPQTGIIQVEVVYKDTGEPVEDAVAVAMSGRVVLGFATVQDGRARFEPDRFLRDTLGGTCTVAVWHAPPERSGTGPTASTFVWCPAECERAVPAAELLVRSPYVFRVERGWRLSGIVKRRDGTLFADALVLVKQGETNHANAFGVTDGTGRFSLAGVEPGGVGQLVVLSLVETGAADWCGLSRNLQGAVPLLRRSVALTGESTSVELEVHTIELTLDLEMIESLWPFRWRKGYSDHEARICVGEASEGADDAEMVHVYFDAERRKGPLGFPKGHYRISLPYCPANEAMTLVVETRQRYFDPTTPGTLEPSLLALGPTPWSARFEVGNPLASSPLTLHFALELLGVSRTQVSLPVGCKDQTLRVVHYEPQARLSRAFWFGVPSMLVLVVFGTILLKQTRKRRAKGAAT